MNDQHLVEEHLHRQNHRHYQRNNKNNFSSSSSGNTSNNNNQQRPPPSHNPQQKRNGTPSSDSPLIRRHTTPDMAASAAYGMVLCGTDELEHRYRGRIEKVRFGVPINEAFCPDIPATLLVLLLKVNKEGPLKKDIWRAPGNQAQVRKLSNIMQHGRLVNISNISVYTAASVIKRFMAKLPGGIFGADNEKRLFDAAQQSIEEEAKRELFCRIISSLPVPSQHLLVLLFGTFRVITDSAGAFGTGMTPEAIGISVAPSLFHTCIHDGQKPTLEDITRFNIASKVVSEIIRDFGYTNLFPRECYEFYARISGRTLRVDEQWHFSFQLPSRTLSQPSIHFESSRSPAALQSQGQLEKANEEEEQLGIHEAEPADEFCEDEDVFGESLPELGLCTRPYARRRDVSRSLDGQQARAAAGWRKELLSRHMRREHRLSSSMGEVVVHSEEEGELGDREGKPGGIRDYLESTRSLTYLEWVHERQTKRMQTRSEWFLSPPSLQSKNGGGGRSYYSRISQRFSASPVHLRAPPKKPTREEYASSGDEEMICCCSSTSGTGGADTGCGSGGGGGAGCGRSGCAASGGGASTDNSMKCSPRRPDSCCTTSGCGSAGDAHMKSQICTEEEGGETSDGDDDAFLADSSSAGEHLFLSQKMHHHQEPPSPSAKMLLLSRQPFQLLQERQYSTSTTEGSASAQVTPSAVELCGSGKNGFGSGVGSGRQRFFGSGEQEGGLQALPELSETATSSSPLPRRFSAPYVDVSPTTEEPQTATTSTSTTQATVSSARQKQQQQKGAKLIQTMSSGSSGSGSGGSGSGGSGASAQTVIGIGGGVLPESAQQQQQQARIAGTSVVRRRSWRTHYTRPKNKSLDCEAGTDVLEEIMAAPSSQSTPLRCSPPLGPLFNRRHSSNGGDGQNKKKGEEERPCPSTAPSSAREALIRRKSSNNNGAKTKPPVQTRRSTQI